MRKASIFILICCILFAGCRHDAQSDSGIDSRNGLRWIKDESYFVDYTIDGEKIIFKYALTFENSAEEDILIRYPTVYFYRFQLWGWMEHQNGYKGKCEDGSSEFIVPAGESRCVICVFEGKYLGGTVKTDLGYPKTVMFIQDIVKEQGDEGQENSAVVP